MSDIKNRQDAEDCFRQMYQLHLRLAHVLLPWRNACGYWSRCSLAFISHHDRASSRDGRHCRIGKNYERKGWHDGSDNFPSLEAAKDACDTKLRAAGFLLLDDEDAVDPIHGIPSIESALAGMQGPRGPGSLSNGTTGPQGPKGGV